jgi:2-polyprenyl-6-methoxyphenol hydroxylase-like FAD-dependent oxidoreductase
MSPAWSLPARRSSGCLGDKVGNLRVLVVGGGIAGLAAARALLRRGIEPDVVERAAAWSQPGAGMYLPANSVRALGALGLQAALLGRACVITRQRFLDHRGRELLEVDLSAVWGATGPCAAISRRGLHEVLREKIPVRLGTTVTALDDQGPLVHAVFDDGSAGDYDLVVGADGVRSWVRTVVFGGAAPRFLGQASWRFLVDGVAGVSAWTVRLGRGMAFLTIPLGGDRVYCYADVNAPAATDPTGGDPAKLAGQYGEFAEPVPAIVRKGLAAADPPTSPRSRRSPTGHGCAAGSCWSATPPTRCRPTWRRAPRWRWRTPWSSPTPSPPAGRSKSSRRGAGPASGSSRRRHTAATARGT